MVEAGLRLVCSTMGLAAPFPAAPPAVLLVEVSSDADPVVALAEAVGSLVGVTATAVAGDESQRRALWRYRELHTEAIARLGPVHKLDVTHAGVTEGRILRERHLAGEVREQAHCTGEHVVEIGCLVEERLDGLALCGRQRTQLGELVDEHAIPLVGGDPTG